MPGSIACGLRAATSVIDTYVGMAGVEPLEATVATEPVDDVGPDPAADARRALQDAHL